MKKVAKSKEMRCKLELGEEVEASLPKFLRAEERTTWRFSFR